jgi:hypothetical protein
MPNSPQFAVSDEKPQDPASADSTVREGSLQEPLQSRHSAQGTDGHRLSMRVRCRQPGSLQEPLQSRHSAQGTDRHRLSTHARCKEPAVCRNPCSRNKTWAARTFASGYQIRSTHHNYVISSLYSELSNENRNQEETKGREKALQTVRGFEKLGVGRHAVWGLGFKRSIPA